MTVVSTSTNNMSGNDQSSNEIGSVFIDGKRQSAWANYSYSANGISAADKLVMDKATRRAAERKLDSSVATPQKGPNKPKNTGKSPIDTCTSNLNSIGISMGSTPKTIKVSYNALKHIKIDKIKVQPKAGTAGSGEVNPFSLSDGEDSEDDSSLLSHLVKDITDVDLVLGTKICDLKVSGCKSKSSSKKERLEREPKKLNKRISP